MSRTAHTGFVLDALEQALHERRPLHRGGLVHHGDRGSKDVSIRYTERLAQAGIAPSVGSVGDSYDNALAERIKGLYKAEVIHRLGPWRLLEAVELAALEWVDWFNHRRLLEPIGNIPPAEAEALYFAAQDNLPLAAQRKPNGLLQTRAASGRDHARTVLARRHGDAMMTRWCGAMTGQTMMQGKASRRPSSSSSMASRSRPPLGSPLPRR